MATMGVKGLTQCSAAVALLRSVEDWRHLASDSEATPDCSSV